MKIEFNKIYRVVCTDNYQSTHPETYWCTDKQVCKDYINKSYYKHCLSIEENVMTDVVLKCTII